MKSRVRRDVMSGAVVNRLAYSGLMCISCIHNLPYH